MLLPVVPLLRPPRLAPLFALVVTAYAPFLTFWSVLLLLLLLFLFLLLLLLQTGSSEPQLQPLQQTESERVFFILPQEVLK